MSNAIRTFIAIPLSLEIRQIITQIQDHLKKLDCDIKWVKPENTHLTLKFLGDVRMEEIDAIKLVLEKLFVSTKAINIELTLLEAFPDIAHPRTLWIGLKDDDGKIKQLVSFLESACGQIGFKKEKRTFNPHITIGRIRSPKNLRLLSEAMSSYAMPAGLKHTGREIALYKSILAAQEPVHEPLHQIHLG